MCFTVVIVGFVSIKIEIPGDYLEIFLSQMANACGNMVAYYNFWSPMRLFWSLCTALINGDYIKLCKDRDYYFSRAHKFNNDNDWKRARQLRNEANKLNRSLKKNYCNKAINENVNNSNKLWSTIKKLIPKNKSSVSSVHTQDGFTANDKGTADQFNSFFTSIGDVLASKFKCNDIEGVDHCSIDEKDTHFKFDVITPDFVFDQIRSFPNNKSTGIDNVCIRLLKLAAPIICHPLAYICNLSLFTSHFPSKWKVKKVTPIQGW